MDQVSKTVGQICCLAMNDSQAATEEAKTSESQLQRDEHTLSKDNVHVLARMPITSAISDNCILFIYCKYLISRAHSLSSGSGGFRGVPGVLWNHPLGNY